MNKQDVTVMFGLSTDACARLDAALAPLGNAPDWDMVAMLVDGLYHSGDKRKASVVFDVEDVAAACIAALMPPRAAPDSRLACGCCPGPPGDRCICVTHQVDGSRVCARHAGRSHNGEQLVLGQCSYCWSINRHEPNCPTGLGRRRW